MLWRALEFTMSMPKALCILMLRPYEVLSVVGFPSTILARQVIEMAIVPKYMAGLPSSILITSLRLVSFRMFLSLSMHVKVALKDETPHDTFIQ